MKTTATITAQNTSVPIGKAIRATDNDTYYASIFVYGSDFGGGTVSIQASPDGGTTKITLDDMGGNAAEFTENGMLNIETGNATKLGDELLLYATIGAATNPVLDIVVYDNR